MRIHRLLSSVLPGKFAMLVLILAWSQPAASHHSFTALQTPEGDDAFTCSMASYGRFGY